jgi:hypothetical protein
MKYRLTSLQLSAIKERPVYTRLVPLLLARSRGDSLRFAVSAAIVLQQQNKMKTVTI